jgi:hypothetical protein
MATGVQVVRATSSASTDPFYPDAGGVRRSARKASALG